MTEERGHVEDMAAGQPQSGLEFEKFDSILPAVPVKQLIHHMAKHYSDRNIVEDLDSVLACCATAEDRAAVRKYARARRGSPGFNASDYRHNNHSRISPRLESAPCGPAALRGDGKRLLRCSVCRSEFPAKRSDARYCSARCRQRGVRDERASSVPPVTGNRPETLAA